jgi:copper chaperone CopZ
METTKLNFATTGSVFNSHINMIANNKMKIEKIKVGQKCENCSKHIVKTAMKVEGVKHAEWDNSQEVLNVEYNSAKTSLKLIELAIADAGHDTPNFKGRNHYYSLMPQCCQSNELSHR